MSATRVRVYDAVRTAHLERFRTMTPATVLYAGRRYDYDPALAEGLDLRPMGRWQTVRHLLGADYDAVELNEPLMTYRWFDLVLQLAAVRLNARRRRRPISVGAYCISLTDPFEKLRRRSRRRLPLPGPVADQWARLMLRALVARFDRLAFGTSATRELLGRYVGDAALERRSRLFPALAAPCDCPATDSRDPDRVLFVGSFEPCKGVPELLAAWEVAHAANPALRLDLIGQGPLLDEATEAADGRDDLTVVVDPPRPDIHRAYRRAHVVVLLSQRVGFWREQVGLPIVEALSHGCEVVATDETGLAGWLTDHGHRVVAPRADADTTAAAILAAAGGTRTAHDVQADLPTVDSRWAADRWLLTGEC